MFKELGRSEFKSGIPLTSTLPVSPLDGDVIHYTPIRASLIYNAGLGLWLYYRPYLVEFLRRGDGIRDYASQGGTLGTEAFPFDAYLFDFTLVVKDPNIIPATNIRTRINGSNTSNDNLVGGTTAELFVFPTPILVPAHESIQCRGANSVPPELGDSQVFYTARRVAVV